MENIDTLIVKTGSAGWVKVTGVPDGLSSATRARRLFANVIGISSGEVVAWMPPTGPTYGKGSNVLPAALPRFSHTYTWGQVFK